MKQYLKALKQFNDFSGRARRKEFWMFFLFNLIVAFILTIIDISVGTYDEETESGIISSVYSLVILIPYLAVATRRMHDIGKSGWFILIPIYNIILACKDGAVGENEYGGNPKEIK